MVLTRSSLCKTEGSDNAVKKNVCSTTQYDDNAFYPNYRRKSPGDEGRSITLANGTCNNSWIVPYCPYFTLRYEAHINIEVCVSPTAAKYLFKYTTIGTARAMASIGYNEVEDYRNYRSIGASEVCMLETTTV